MLDMINIAEFDSAMNESMIADMLEVDILKSAMKVFDADMKDVQDKYEQTLRDIERIYNEGIV